MSHLNDQVKVSLDQGWTNHLHKPSKSKVYKDGSHIDSRNRIIEHPVANITNRPVPQHSGRMKDLSLKKSSLQSK